MTVTAETYRSVSDFGTARRCGQALSAAILQRMTQTEAAAIPDTVIIGDRNIKIILRHIIYNKEKESTLHRLKHRYDEQRPQQQAETRQAEDHSGKSGRECPFCH